MTSIPTRITRRPTNTGVLTGPRALSTATLANDSFQPKFGAKASTQTDATKKSYGIGERFKAGGKNMKNYFAKGNFVGNIGRDIALGTVFGGALALGTPLALATIPVMIPTVTVINILSAGVRGTLQPGRQSLATPNASTSERMKGAAKGFKSYFKKEGMAKRVGEDLLWGTAMGGALALMSGGIGLIALPFLIPVMPIVSMLERATKGFKYPTDRESKTKAPETPSNE